MLLRGSPQSVKMARDWMAKVAVDWGLDDDYVARLAVSELVTNASRNGGRWVLAKAYVHHGAHRIEVWDRSPGQPAIQEAEDMSESGRGLFLLDHLAASWGTRSCFPAQGKVVWVELHPPY